MNNIREVLEAQFYGTAMKGFSTFQFDTDKANKFFDLAELAINKIFKENYKRLALDVIGEDEYSGQFASSDPRDERYMGRDDLRNDQRATLSNQLNNMKGE
jgi:hypothetical protein